MSSSSSSSSLLTALSTTSSSALTPFLATFRRVFGSPQIADGLRILLVGFALEGARCVCGGAWRVVAGVFTSTAHLESPDESFEWVMAWLEAQPRWSSSADFHVSVPRSIGADDTSTAVVRYLPSYDRPQWLTYHGWPLRVSRSRQGLEGSHASSSGREAQRESLTITAFTLSCSVLPRLIEQAREVYLQTSQSRLVVHMADQYGNWRRLASKPHRSLASVVLPRGVKERLRADAQEFLDSEEWYAARGTPYRRGYLLYGTPGSGKSSTIHALASELRLEVYVVSLSLKGLDDAVLADLTTSTPSRCILLFEDLDAAFSSRSGLSSSAQSPSNSSVTLSGLLNAIDGVAAQEGRLLFATSNYADRLDLALSRPGRIDVKIEYTHASRSQAAELFRRFYPPSRSREEKEEEEALQLADAFAAGVPEGRLSVSQLQGYLMLWKDKPRAAVAGLREWIREELGE